jgi:hypothetical protein
MTARPDRSEAASYYFTYIDQVPPDTDILRALASQVAEVEQTLGGVPEERSLHRYAADKWSLREVMGHLNDTERLFVSRAFWFARGFDSPLPSFDQNVAVAASAADERLLGDHLDEFRAVRAATVSFFRGLPRGAWLRRGVASDNPFTVRALAFMAVGHVTHHLTVVRQRYM